jgi:hypothetical protein
MSCRVKAGRGSRRRRGRWSNENRICTFRGWMIRCDTCPCISSVSRDWGHRRACWGLGSYRGRWGLVFSLSNLWGPRGRHSTGPNRCRFCRCTCWAAWDNRNWRGILRPICQYALPIRTILLSLSLSLSLWKFFPKVLWWTRGFIFDRKWRIWMCRLWGKTKGSYWLIGWIFCKRFRSPLQAWFRLLSEPWSGCQREFLVSSTKDWCRTLIDPSSTLKSMIFRENISKSSCPVLRQAHSKVFLQ